MPNFPKPHFNHAFTVELETSRLRAGKITEQKNTPIPAKSAGHLLLATWNIANFGSQDREDKHLRLIAEVLSWFDIVAIQEVKDNLGDIRKVLKFLPEGYKVIFSDVGGNDERSLFLYDGKKLSLLEKVGEVNIPPKDYDKISIPGVASPFKGFDRSPYIASFKKGAFKFLAVSVHNFFGSESQEDMERRSLETYAIGRWADLRRDDKDAYIKDNILVMGDFNLPMVKKGDPVYDALVKRGLELPDHSTRVYSNIGNDQQYDQIAFFPGLKSTIKTGGVFSFDNFIFPELFQNKTPAQFRSYLRYYISDHRPMWVQFEI